jgi:hypothetical protein
MLGPGALGDYFAGILGVLKMGDSPSSAPAERDH